MVASSLGISALLALGGDSSDPVAATIILAYLVPVSITAVYFGRKRAVLVVLGCLAATVGLWPGAQDPAKLLFLAFIAGTYVAALIVAPWLWRPSVAPADGTSRRSAARTQAPIKAEGTERHENSERRLMLVHNNSMADEGWAAEEAAESGVEVARKAAGAENDVVPGVTPGAQTQPGLGGAGSQVAGLGPLQAAASEPSASQEVRAPDPGATDPQPENPVGPAARPTGEIPRFVTAARTERDLLIDLFSFCRSQVLACEAGVFYRPSSAEQLTPSQWFGLESGDLAGIAATRGVGLVGVVALSGRPQLRLELETDVAEPDTTRALYAHRGLHSATAVALLNGNTILGVLALYSRRASAFSLADATIVEHACVAAAPVLSHIRGLAELEGQVQEARLVIEMARHLGPHGDLGELMAFVIETAKGMIGGDVASVMLTDPTTSELWIGRADGLPADVVESTKLAPGCGIAGWVAEHGRPLIVKDFPFDGSNGKVKWAVSVPLRDNGSVVGVLNVGSSQLDKDIGEDEMKMLLRLASQAGASIQNARALSAMQELHFQTMRALVGAIEAADPYGRGHSENVARYAAAIARRMGVPGDKVRLIETAGMLHDVGKATLGEGLLRKEKPLTTVEQTAIQLHPAMATQILKDVPMLAEVIPAISHHHERYDGGGYAQGLRGEEIPLAARILAVADAFDAITSERAWRPARSMEEAIAEVARGAGTQFDPAVVKAFRELLVESPDIVGSR